MKKLYSLVQTDDSRKADLYIRGQSSHSALKSALHKDEILDFCTYFNSISIKKWRQYTTIQQVMLELSVEGSFELIVSMHSPSGEQILIQEKINGPIYRKTWHIDELSGDIAGFSLRALEDGAQCWGGAYYGEFSQWREKKIGIGICTFKREKYVLRTIDHLQEFQKNNKWLQVLVVDNGSTLQEQNREGLRIIHNRNFGGSGGFTRAMIEYVDEDQVDYVLLMDDDIVLDSTALERTHSLLCGLKNEYKDSFLAYPAAVRNHHDYVRGLIDHTVSMCEVAEFVSKHYEGVNYDLLMSGCLLHDIGKIVELSGPIATQYTFEGNLLGHLYIGANLVALTAEKLGISGKEVTLLQHLILSHHGKLEFGAAVLPLTREALILSMIDDMDAKMMMLDKAYKDVEEGSYTERLFGLDNRAFYKSKIE